ncbi:MAG: tRNA (adenosine(37)-N6)-threonylcarbamoyltransferase complex transferase subunit TsaD [Clostridia bacterium]|nr:tRNA (adenosine(37)-N6)-threonylcarbamoyltransferase complex transferase subunit TsaD [Clostridia bacterium]
MYLERAKKQFEELSKKKIVRILAIESSCDETSIAIIENGRKILSNIVSSQIEIHKLYGGVVPEIASRNHILAISNLYREALEVAKLKEENIDAIAVTYGAGLVGALLVGVNFAKSLAFSLDLPLIAVSHIQGHIAANYLTYKKLEPPFVCLMISGGHTAILDIKGYTKHKLLGTTVDDAAGEAFDKVARVLGLSYPGGPNVDRCAKTGNDQINFTQHSSLSKTLNFSFSGIKTAVINYVHKLKQNGEEPNVADVCASFQRAVTDELVAKAIKACKLTDNKKLVVAGGVSANSKLKESLIRECKGNGIELYIPELSLCTDNAAMIGSAAYFMLKEKKGLAKLSLTAKATVSL